MDNQRGRGWSYAAQRAGLSALVALCAVLALTHPAVARRAAGGIVYAQHPCTLVYAAPSPSAPPLTQLMGGNEATLLGTVTGTDNASWSHILIWSGVEAYAQAGALAAGFPSDAGEGDCTFPGLPDTPLGSQESGSGPWPLTATGIITAPTTLTSAPSLAAFPVAAAEVGKPVHLDAWMAGPSGMPWYRVTLPDGSGWIPVTAVRLDQPDPATHRVGSVPIGTVAAGKGMSLFKNYLVHHSDVAALARAARLAGLTHVYAEVAISTGGLGFYGRDSLDRLLPVAHANGLKVIAAVYPALDDVASDARMTAEVAAYRTPTHDSVDGIATDVEENTTASAVYAYGQVVRALIGPDMPLVAIVLHPLSHSGYPYAAIATSWNVISPMNYWYSNVARAYTAADTVRFVTTSLITIRAAVGPAMPIEELGQTYVEDHRYGDGVAPANAPTADETIADLRMAHQLGCVGISFYAWQTATQAEWQAIAATPW
ncbi:MAG TPA: hypothetical protein VGR57_03700 [Ktedonobacterales bacterium]|nr:hypothetical protein [Ktedonobacterales bacterium]